MNNKILEKIKRKNSPEYLISPLITILILLTVFFILRIYPFGTKSIVCIDMGQSNVPIYYWFHDVLHGKCPFLFSWNSGAGTNMIATITNNCLLNPLNALFFLVVPRESILQSMTFFVILKMALMSLFMFILLEKIYKNLNLFFKTIFSTLYAFSGYVLQYYTNVMWLDIVLVFPLLILSLYFLLNKDKIIPYVLALTFCLINNVYLSFMILLYLLIIGGMYSLIFIKENKAKTIFNFGIGTVISLMASSVVLIPSVKQIQKSSRYNGPDSSYLDILKVTQLFSTEKIAMLLSTSIFIAMIFLLWKHLYKKEKSKAMFICFSNLIMILPIFFENINLIWHKGSYVGFPIRFGFMISLTLILSAGYLLNNYSITLFSIKNNNFTFLAIAILIFIIVFFSKNLKLNTFHPFYISIKNVIIFILLTIFYAICVKINNKKLSDILISSLLFIEVFINSYFAFNVSDNAFERKLEFIDLNNNIYSQQILKSDSLSRLKNSDTLLNANYPFLLNYPAMSNWTHLISKDLQPLMNKLGYTTHYTRILDSGGTAFSDALLNIKNTITTEELNNTLYEKIYKIGDFYLYKNIYTIPFGTVTSKDILNENLFNDSCKENQNNLYKIFSGKNVDILTSCNLKKVSDNKFTLKVKDTKNLYLTPQNIDNQLKIYINDKIVPVPSVSQKENIFYPAMFNSNLLNLGCFKDETISIKFEGNSDIITFEPHILCLDVDMLKEFSDNMANHLNNISISGETLIFDVNSDKNNSILFLPLLYDESWYCTVNGRKVGITKILDAFIGINLPKQNSKISLRFIPSGMKIGLAITLFAVLFLILIISFGHKLKFLYETKICSILIKSIFSVMLFTTILFLYCLPILYTFLHVTRHMLVH